MKALVTGGGGFLGSRIARMLDERGDEVTVFGRSDYPQFAGSTIQTVRGDIRDEQAVMNACRGMDVVVHAAATTGVWGPRRVFREINVDGTRHVVDACRAGGVQRLVYTSSPSVVFGDEELCGVDETQPYPGKYLAAYPRTKALAERMVLAANGAHLATIALRPHLIWGPGDPHLIPRVVDLARRGRLVQVGDGHNRVDLTFIDNAAAAHLRACDALELNGRSSGRPFFISQGEPVRLWSWINELLERLGIRRVTRSISYRSAYRMGAVLEAVYSVSRLRSEPRMTRFIAAQLAKSHYFNISAARDVLDYQPVVSMAEGMERLMASSKAGGLRRRP